MDTWALDSNITWNDLSVANVSLAEVWPVEMRCPVHLLACAQSDPAGDEVWTYAQDIGGLLGAYVNRFHAPLETGIALDTLLEEVTHTVCDLVLLKEPEQSPVERLLLGSVGRRVVERIPTSLLFVRRPRWPLREILLVVQGDEGDDVALDWVVRLARFRAITVTVSSVVPPVPAMYCGMDRMGQGMASLLAGNSALGRQMRWTAQQLAEYRIEHTLRLCQGTPDLEVRREMVGGDHDLVVVSAGCSHQWLRYLMGELVVPMLRWAVQPVLIARPS
jgi:nucleotide-binding universal stress UspA family protein